MILDLEPRPDIGACGRATKTGGACKHRTERFIPACKLHHTEDEVRLGEYLTKVQREGCEDGKATASYRIIRLEEEIEKLRTKDDLNHRQYSDSHGQFVEVEGYTYRWTGTPALEVGDEVLLPPNYVSRLQGRSGPYPGRVTAFGSTYKGPLSTIVSRSGTPAQTEAEAVATQRFLQAQHQRRMRERSKE